MASDTDSTGNNLLNVENLSVTFNTHHGTVEAVRDISFTIGREKVGIVGDVHVLLTMDWVAGILKPSDLHLIFHFEHFLG